MSTRGRNLKIDDEKKNKSDQDRPPLTKKQPQLCVNDVEDP